MQWVTRARPKTDRIACPWLIRRFIDPDGEIVFVPVDQVLEVASRTGGHSFDSPGATYGHRRHDDAPESCTFETLLHEFGLTGNAALVELARIVHAADIKADAGSHPFGPALRAIGEAGLHVEEDDHRLLERGEFVYDALYAHCEGVTGALR